MWARADVSYDGRPDTRKIRNRSTSNWVDTSANDAGPGDSRRRAGSGRNWRSVRIRSVVQYDWRILFGGNLAVRIVESS